MLNLSNLQTLSSPERVVNIAVGKSDRIKSGEESLFVSFDYSMEAVAAVKSLETRYYIPSSRKWEVPVSEINNLISTFAGFQINLKGKVETKVSGEVVEPRVTFDAPEVDTNDFDFKTTPFPHQKEAFAYAMKNKKFLLGDEQGLGKTKQAIDIAVSRKDQFKHCLIVCGVNSVKWNWVKEIETHSNETSHVLGSYINTKGKLTEGSMQDRLDDLQSDLDDFFLITNIESFRQSSTKKKKANMSKQELTQAELLATIEHLTKTGKIGMVIIDEIHKAKNSQSQQGKAIHKLQPDYKMALTGTPLMNQPLDLFNVLKWLEVEKHSYFQFKNRYCEMGGFGGYEVVGYKNLNELRANLDKAMLRRKKDEVLNLPPKIRSTEYVEMTGKQQLLYKEVITELRSSLDDIEFSPNPLAQLTRLRQVTSCPQILTENVLESAKLDRMEELIEEMVENGQKAVIFSNWKQVTKRVKQRLAKYNPAYIDGDTKDRMDQVNKFQEDKSCKVIIGTIGAMGTGLTLTAASNVIFIDKPWNLANTEQAEDRAHRIGTTGTVNIITIVVKDSVDEKIEEIIIEKGDMAEALVDGNLTKLNKKQMMERLIS